MKKVKTIGLLFIVLVKIAPFQAWCMADKEPKRTETKVDNLLRTQIVFEAIDALAASGERDKAIRVAIGEIRQIRDDLSVGEVVAKVKSELIKQYKEKVIRRETSDRAEQSSLLESFNFALSVSIGLISGEFLDSRNTNSFESHRWKSVTDVAEWFEENPKEAAEWSIREAQDGEDLQRALKLYVSRAAPHLLNMRLLAISVNRLYFDSLMKGEEVSVSVNEINQIRDLVSDIRFKGSHQVTLCIQHDHASKIMKHEASHRDTSAERNYVGGRLTTLVPLPSILPAPLRLGASGAMEESNLSDRRKSYKWGLQTYAHKVRSCNSDLKIREADINDHSIAVDFAVLDRALNAWEKVIHIASIVCKSNENVSHCFNNPFLR